MGVDIATYRSRVGCYYGKATSKSQLKTNSDSGKCDCENYKNLNQNDVPLSTVTSDDINALRKVVKQFKSVFVEDSKLVNDNKSSEVKSDHNVINNDSTKPCESGMKSFIREFQPKEKLSIDKFNSVTRCTYEIEDFIEKVTENDQPVNSLENVMNMINIFTDKHHLNVENCPELCLLIHLLGISKDIECTDKNAGVPLFKRDQLYNGTVKLSHAGYILQYFFCNVLGRSCQYQDGTQDYVNKNMCYWQLSSIPMGLSSSEFNKAITEILFRVLTKILS